MKPQVKQFWVFEYFDFENLVMEEYELEDYSFASEEEVSNDTVKLYNGIRRGELESYDSMRLEELKAGNAVFKARVILTDLCNRGKIPPGDYMIKVSW